MRAPSTPQEMDERESDDDFLDFYRNRNFALATNRGKSALHETMLTLPATTALNSAVPVSSYAEKPEPKSSRELRNSIQQAFAVESANRAGKLSE